MWYCCYCSYPLHHHNKPHTSTLHYTTPPHHHTKPHHTTPPQTTAPHHHNKPPRHHHTPSHTTTPHHQVLITPMLTESHASVWDVRRPYLADVYFVEHKDSIGGASLPLCLSLFCYLSFPLSSSVLLLVFFFLFFIIFHVLFFIFIIFHIHLFCFF